MARKKKINLHKWFPFLHSWTSEEEIKMIRMVKNRLKEIEKARKVMKLLGLKPREIPKQDPYPFG